MSHYSGSIPDILDHGRDWLEKAVCKADPDAMHPDSNEAGIAYAKQICQACPVQMACLQDALRIGDNEHGIRGGLRPNERRAVSKRLTEEQYGDPAAVAEAVQHVLHPSLERTLQDIWEEHTYPLPDGHIGWRGNRTPRYQDGNRTPGWVSFVHDRGREPDGPVRRTCDVEGCAHPQHVADNQERWERQQTEPAQDSPEAPAVKRGGRKLAECGTHSAYQRHVRNKEPIDDACRAANAAAHARYKRSGSTKTATV